MFVRFIATVYDVQLHHLLYWRHNYCLILTVFTNMLPLTIIKIFIVGGSLSSEVS